MLGSFAARADPTDLRRLRTAAQGWLDASSGAPGSLAVVAALPCREPGCPPFETAVQVLSEQPFSFVIRKLAADVDDDELVRALAAAAEASRQQAAGAAGQDSEQGGTHDEDAHDLDDGRVIEAALLASTVESIVEATPAIDVHTHLFPPSHGDLFLSGIDALLTYHYLVSEFFMVASGLAPAAFFAQDVKERAAQVWVALFVRRTPVSEAQIGVLTTLRLLGAGEFVAAARRSGDLAELRAWFAAKDPQEHTRRIFAAANVRYVVCTNVPFDAAEASRFVVGGCCIDADTAEFVDGGARLEPDAGDALRFRTALRVDALLAGDWGTFKAALEQRGLDATLASARTFLRAWAKRYGAEYLMASSPAGFSYAHLDDAPLEPGWPTCTQLVDEVLVPVAAELNLPLALKLGCIRGMAPDLGPVGGGDGVEVADTAPLRRLCLQNPKLKVLATFLARGNQHEACVLAQKFRNLHLYGCWWYCNNPSIIAEVTTMRLELLGTAFTAQHSDCRVLEQLVYKWHHARRAIAAALVRQYLQLLETGWALTRGDVRRDARTLLGGAYEEFLAKDL
ncbi:hypothetical protein M885DRAFT_550801 [Pelagophyceae sp. CCMP2097]|nr:hypothetical protein M885DRAFT_550801 [Pelagophyceae sp. CCMP2097]